MDVSSQWLPLMDYAIKRGVSLSTLRRHIKANKIKYKVENGRYLVLDDAVNFSPTPEADSGLQPALQKLQMDLQKAQEEIAELKTLIALYEEKLPTQRFSI